MLLWNLIAGRIAARIKQPGAVGATPGRDGCGARRRAAPPIGAGAALLALLVTAGYAAGRPPEGAAPMNRYPSIELQGSHLRLLVYLPDPGKGYYRGTRFDHAGMVGRVEAAGHRYYADWKSPHDPEDPEAGVGPCEEFGSPVPPGYAAARAGDPFLKIGVGVLARGDEAAYSFMRRYRVLAAGSWTTRHGADWVEFRQELAGPGGWAYDYTKRIQLASDRPAFTLRHTLRNRGRAPLRTNVYNHNFTTIDEDPAGPAYRVRLPFQPTVAPTHPLKPPAALRGMELLFERVFAAGESVYTELQGFGRTAADHRFTIENSRAGAAVEVRADRPLAALRFWTTRTAVCPEPVVDLDVAPGAEQAWSATYTFSTVANGANLPGDQPAAVD